MTKASGIVFDIKHFAVHDGPGIRTTIFLKGCQLRCLWCHSPESQKFDPEVLFYPDRCIQCKACIDVCSEGVLKDPRDLSPEGCSQCWMCAEICFSGARELIGQRYTVKEILIEVAKDRLIYELSGGGVTVSGGEPTAQPDFLFRLLKALRKEGYHTTLDTCGFEKWEIFERVLPYLDLILYDLKHLDPDSHFRLTGQSNDLILSNLKKLSEEKVRVIVRVPLIPDCNDSDEHLSDLARYLLELRIKSIEVLPYHRLGISKYRSLGRKYPLENLVPHVKSRILGIKELLQGYGLKVEVEGFN